MNDCSHCKKLLSRTKKILSESPPHPFSSPSMAMLVLRPYEKHRKSLSPKNIVVDLLEFQ